MWRRTDSAATFLLMNVKTLHRTLNAGAMEAAPKLLGCVIEHHGPCGLRSGMIVETEAYTEDDPAAHSYVGRTARTDPMFRRAGTLYVYLSYGIHNCMNVATADEGRGEAVLVRAIEPIDGVEEMIRARRWKGRPLRNLANGPGKVCQALGISLEYSGQDLLTNGVVRLRPGSTPPPADVDVTPRIGITKAADWPRRFVWKRH